MAVELVNCDSLLPRAIPRELRTIRKRIVCPALTLQPDTSRQILDIPTWICCWIAGAVGAVAGLKRRIVAFWAHFRRKVEGSRATNPPTRKRSVSHYFANILSVVCEHTGVLCSLKLKVSEDVDPDRACHQTLLHVPQPTSSRPCSAYSISTPL